MVALLGIKEAEDLLLAEEKAEAKKVTWNCATLTSEFVQVMLYMKDFVRRTHDAGKPRDGAGGGGGLGGGAPALQQGR